MWQTRRHAKTNGLTRSDREGGAGARPDVGHTVCPHQSATLETQDLAVGEEWLRDRDGQSKIALALISQIYRVEREIKAASTEQRLRVRQCSPAQSLGSSRPGSIRWPALSCCKARWVKPRSAWSKLLPFLQHPQIPLDTNRVENAIRPFVTERSLCTS